MGRRGTVVGMGSNSVVVRLDEPLGDQSFVTFITGENDSQWFQIGDRVVWWPNYDERALRRYGAMSDRLVRESELVPAEVAYLLDSTTSEEEPKEPGISSEKARRR
jgi:hypothetical protein